MSFSDIDKKLVDSLLIFYMRVRELRRTKFYNYYKHHSGEVSVKYETITRNVKVRSNDLEDENDEFLRSFIAILRLFFLDRDKFSLRHLGGNYFNPDGLLSQQFLTFFYSYSLA